MKMMKRIASCFLALLMVATTIIPASATEAQENTAGNVGCEKNIFYYGTNDIENIESADVVVLEEDQLRKVGKSISEMITTDNMVYVVTSISQKELMGITGLPSKIVSVDDTNLAANCRKIGTAISMDTENNYRFHDTYAMQVGDTDIKGAIDNYAAEGLLLAINGAEEAERELLVSQRNASFSDLDYTDLKRANVAIYYGNTKVGTMGHVTYFYYRGRKGSEHVYDTVCVATFAPQNQHRCREMSVYLGGNWRYQEILEATAISSSGMTHTNSLSLSRGVTGFTGMMSTSWSYSADAQTVIKEWDLTTNDRKWIFRPANPLLNDAWVEAPGIRTYVSQGTVGTTTVELDLVLERGFAPGGLVHTDPLYASYTLRF